MSAPAAQEPAVTVVVPTFSRPELLERCVRAVLAQQTAFPFEVVVVDDGGEPPAAQTLAGLADPRLRVVRAPNGGPARARNRGLREARTALVGFTDDDCEPQPGWLAAAVAAFARPEVVMVQGPAAPPAPASPLAWHYIHTGNARHDLSCNLFVRRAEALAAGGFDEGFKYPAGEDYDFCWRLERRGEVLFAPEARVVHALIPISWKKRRAPVRHWGSYFRLYALHPERAHRLRLPVVERLLGRVLDRAPKARLGTYLLGIQALGLVRNVRTGPPLAFLSELGAYWVNLADGARHLPEYLREYDRAVAQRAARAEAPPRP